jgi:hypothetical protein
MQSLVYESPAEKQHDLLARTAVAAGTIWEILGIFQTVQQNMQAATILSNFYNVKQR